MNNKDFINGMSTEMSQEFKDKLPTTMSDNAIEVYNAMEQYPTMRNEFIDVLTNKIIKQKFLTKVFNNPLKMFHKGEVPYGDTIENIFVESAVAKGFREHFKEDGNVENDLIGELKPSVKVNYMTKNFEYKFKVSISELQMRTAFMNADGLSKLVSDQLKSLTNGAYIKEFKDMKELIKEVCNGNKFIRDEITGKPKVEKLTIKDVKSTIKTLKITGADVKPSLISETVRGLIGRLSFPSTEYNMSGVETWSNNDELVFITTPEIQAKIDVNVLAEAFNVSKAELNSRTVLIDELPTKFAEQIGTPSTTDVECYGILVDSEFIQMYDTILAMRKFDNGANLSVNHFLHKHGILCNCFFKNSVAIIKG